MKAFIDALNEKIDDTDHSGVNIVNNNNKWKIHTDMQLTNSSLWQQYLSLYCHCGVFDTMSCE